jgi:hypothetical protein
MWEGGAILKISTLDDFYPVSLVADEVVLVIGKLGRLIPEGAGLI